MGMDKGSSSPKELKLCLPLLFSIAVIFLYIPSLSHASTESEEVSRVLAEEALKLPIQQFEGDEVLNQKWDSESDSTQYWHPNNGLEPMYTKPGKNSEEVLVLSRNDDKLSGAKDHSSKQTYVVLRRKPEETDVYFPMYAYLRNERPDESCTVQTNQSKCIEWDSWEMRVVEDPTIWLDCSSQVFLSCGFNVTVFEKDEQFKTTMPALDAGDEDPIVATYLEATTDAPEVAELDLSDDMINSTDYDFFDDLHGYKKSELTGRGFMDDLRNQKKMRVAQVTPGTDGKVMDLCLDPSRSRGPNCFNGLGLSLDAHHPLQYSLSSTETKRNPKLNGKPNYKNYQPIGKVVMPNYKIGNTFGVFNPENTALKGVKGNMFVFGAGSLDIFKADADSVFGAELPDDKGTVGTYSACKASDPDCMIHGVLIPLSKNTAYMIRSGLAYPATFKSAIIPLTRGFVMPLEHKQTDLFYPDTFINNNLKLNTPLEKPMGGKLSPISQWKNDFPVKDGMLLPRRWVASTFIRKEKTFDYGKFTERDGKVPPVRVAVIPGQDGNPDEFHALEDQIKLPTKAKKNMALVGKVTLDSDLSKDIPVFAIPSARPGEVDKFVPSSVWYVEPVAVVKSPAYTEEVTGLLKIAVANKGTPLLGTTSELYLYKVDLKAPGIHHGTLLAREDGSQDEGTLNIDKTVNPIKFTTKVQMQSRSTTPSAPPQKVPQNKPKAASPKPVESRYPTYKLIGSLPEPQKYHIGFETGTFTPDDTSKPSVSVKTYILGMDRLDMLQANKNIFGSLYPADKAIAGTYTPTNPNPTHEIHGVLIPLNENTGVMFRSGLGYPCTFKFKGSEILGFYSPSMRKTTEFFFPESYITFKDLALPYHKPIKGQIIPEEHVQKDLATLDGQVLPRGDGVPSIFIRTTIVKLQGTWKPKDDGVLPPAKLLVIPGNKLKPDEFYPLEDTVMDSPNAVKGVVSTDPPTKDRPTTFIRSPSDTTPDHFLPDETYEVSPIKFHTLKRKLEPLKGFLYATKKDIRIPPRLPVEVIFDVLHQQPIPSKLAGNLETTDSSQIRGNIILHHIDGPFTFFPDVRDVPKEELNEAYQPGGSQKYKKMVPIGKDDAPKEEPARGVTMGNFIPDRDNNGKAIRVVVHANGPSKLDYFEADDPVFGRELPEDRGVPGTYRPEDRRGKKTGESFHGILIPVDKRRAFFLLDGTGYLGSFTSKEDPKPIQGFIVPIKGKSDRFYIESYITFTTVIRKPRVEGKIIPDKSVETQYSPRDIVLILKRNEPSIIIQLEDNPEDGVFNPEDPKRKPVKGIVVPASSGNPDEFYPLEDDDDKGDEPLPGTVKSPTKEISARLIPNLLPGAPDEFIVDDDPANKPDLVPVTISSTENDLNNVKAFVKLPPNHAGPPIDPTPLFVTDTMIQNLPTRIQITMKMPDGSTVVGLLAADSPTGPHTFYPGSGNPTPTSLKLMPKYNEIKTDAEPVGADSAVVPKNPTKTPQPVSGHRGYPSYVPIGLSKDKIVMKLGVTLGNFVPDEENDGKPLKIAVHVIGPKSLDNVESEKPIFGQELPAERGTEGTYQPEDIDGKKSDPIRGVLIPVDQYRGYFLRNGVGYLAKFSPVPKLKETPETWGFVVPSPARTADHFYPESFIVYNLKAKPRVKGQLEPDKKSKGTYKGGPCDLLIRKAEANILVFKDMRPIDEVFQDDANTHPPKKMLVVPGNGGNPDEFYPLDDDEEPDSGDGTPIKGVVKGDPGIEQSGTMIPNSVPGAPDTFIPDDEGEPILVTIESSEVPLDDVKAYATISPDEKGPLKSPTPLSVTKGAEKIPSRMQATVTLPNQPPVDGLLVANAPPGQYTFFPGMKNPEPTKPKPLELVSPDKIKKIDPKESTPEANKESESPKEEAGRSETPIKPKSTKPTALVAPDSNSEDEEESTSLEQVPPEENKCKETGKDYPTYVQYGTSADVIQYSTGVTTGVFSTEDGKDFPVVVHVIGIDTLDVLESEDAIFGSKLPDSEGTVGTYLPDNPKSGSIRGVLLPVNKNKALILRDGIAYISTFNSENGESPPVTGFIVPSMTKNRDGLYFYPQAYSCAIISSRVTTGEMVPHSAVEDFFEKSKGQLILDAWGPSVFLPNDLPIVEGTFQDSNSALPPSKVLVIPKSGVKPDEFYPIENVLQNGELSPGKISTPDKEFNVFAIARPSKQRPDLFFPEEESIEIVTLISKDRSVPKQKACLVAKTKPKGPLKSPVKIVPLTKKLTLPFKIEVTILMDDGTFLNGLLVENGAKDSFTLYPYTKDPMPKTATDPTEGQKSRKPGSKSKYPTYVQYGTSADPIEYMTGITTGNLIPDDNPDKSFVVVVTVEGIGKLDRVEFKEPVFGTKLPKDKAIVATYTPESKKGKTKPLHGALIAIDEKTAYLIRDGLAYTSIFVPHKKKAVFIEGFLLPSCDKTKVSEPFIPDSYLDPNISKLKGILDGILVPDAETTKYFRDTPGKLVTNKKKPYTFISIEVKFVQGEFQDSDNKLPSKLVLVIAGKDGNPDEFYPLDDDLLPDDSKKPVKGSVKTPDDKVNDVVVIPSNVPGGLDTIVPEKDKEVSEVTIKTPEETLKAQMISPKGETGRPRKPVDVIITDPMDKLKPRTEVTLNLKDDTKVPGLLVAVPEEGLATFYPGLQDCDSGRKAPNDPDPATESKPKPNEDKKEKPKTSTSPTPTKGDSTEKEKPKQKPETSKYPSYVEYGTSADPVEYKVGVTVGKFTPEQPKKEPLSATVFVFGVDQLDIIEFDVSVFGTILPDKMGTIGVYNAETALQKPIRGVVIPIDEKRAYLVRDGVAYTAIFYPKEVKESVPTKIIGFLIPSLSGDRETDLFVAESYILFRDPLSKQNLLQGSMVPGTEAVVFFQATIGKLLTRGYEPSIYVSENIEMVPGTFQDEMLLHSPIKVHVIPGKDGKPDYFYPDEDEMPDDETKLKGTVTTPWKMTAVILFPSNSPEIPAKIVVIVENEPEWVTFEKNPGPVKGYLIQEKGRKGLPKKSTDVVLSKPEDKTLPTSQEANLIMGDGLPNPKSQPPQSPRKEVPRKPAPAPEDAKDNNNEDDVTPENGNKRPKKSGMYPTYNPHTLDGPTIEYFIGTTEGTFLTDDDPPKSLTVTFNVLGQDKLDILVSSTPIFGSELPIEKGTVGTFQPDPKLAGKNPQRSLHGVVLPIDEFTAFVVRDGLAYPVTLYLTESDVEFHGFFVPLTKRPIEMFYPDSIKMFEPIIAKVTADSPTNIIPSEIVPDEEIDKLSFPDSKGKIVFNRLGPNTFVSEQVPEQIANFKDDEGKISIDFKIVEGTGGQPNEYIPVGKDLPEITGIVNGTLVDPSKPAAKQNIRVVVLLLPKAQDGDILEYEVYPELMFTVREVVVSTRDKKLKYVQGYVISPKDATENSPMEVAFKTFKPKLSQTRYSGTVSFVDDESVVNGMLITYLISGPHTVYPSGGKLNYGSKQPTFEIAPNKQTPNNQSPNEQSPTNQSPKSQSSNDQSPTSQSPKSQSPNNESPTEKPKPKESPRSESPAAKSPEKPEQLSSDTTDKAKPKVPKKPLTPTPVFAEENDDWPLNMIYESPDGSPSPVGSSPADKKPDKAIQAIIVPWNEQNGNLFVIKGKIPTSTPERGKPMAFLPYKSEEAKIDYFRGTLKMPGNPAGDLEGRFRAPKKASTPPVFIVDPLNSDPAIFVANNNRRVDVYGFATSLDGEFRFQPDEPSQVPTQPSPGILSIFGKQNKVGVLMNPTKPDEPCEFRTDSNQRKPDTNLDRSKPIEIYFYPDLDTIKPLKGKIVIIGNDKTFALDDAASVDKSLFPLHGLFVSPTDVIPSEFGFLQPAASDGKPLPVKSDKPGTILADFRPDTSVTIIIRGVFIEATGQFIPSSGQTEIPYDQPGTLDKKNTQGQPSIGKLTKKNDQTSFVPTSSDDKSFEASFYPDVVNSEPTEGIFILYKGKSSSGEFRPFAGEVIQVDLPVSGQIIPKADTHPQFHGTLMPNKGSSEFNFEQDPPDAQPEYEISLMAQKKGGGGGDPNVDVSTQIVYIWGFYFVGIGKVNIFILQSGTTGFIVANDRPATDPNAIKFEGLLRSHLPKKTPSGEEYYATFTPNHKGRENNLPTDFPTGIEIKFYPAGAISGGFQGKVIQIDEIEWAIVVEVKPTSGRWRSPSKKVTQFTYSENGQLVAYDASLIWFRTQERDKMTGVKVKGGYYQGMAGKSVIIPEAYKSGAMFIISGEDKVHGKVYPLDRGKIIKFLPDDEPTIYAKVKKAGNKLSGQLDLDESLSVNGKTPDNGIPCSMSLNEFDEFIITPNTNGQWGYFTQGKKALPTIVIMVFGGVTSEKISGRTLGGSVDEESKCSHPRQTYYLHEQDTHVLQVCRSTSDKSSERSGYYPFSEEEADENDSADADSVRSGIAVPMNTGANLFVSSNGVSGEFLVLDTRQVSIHLDSLTSISGKVFYMPDANRLMFKPDNLNLLLEETKSGGKEGIKGLFKSTLGEDMLSATLRLTAKGVSGVLSLGKQGQFGVVYLTGNEPVVAGTRMKGRTLVGEKRTEKGESHGVLYETGGTGMFLEGDGDVSGIFIYNTMGGNDANESVNFYPELGLLSSPTTFAAEFRKTVKQNKTLVGKLYISDKDTTILGSLTKSKRAPMAYHFTPSIPFRVGWLSSRKVEDQVESYFMDDEAIDVFQHPGWKTQYLSIEPGITNRFENRVFYGLGNCPSDPRITIEDYKKSSGVNDNLINFFLKVLRTHCLKKHFTQVKRLVDSGILEIFQEANGKILRLAKSNKLLSTRKLTKRETEDISAAFSIAVLSQTYVEQLFQQDASFKPTDVEEKPLSRSAYFFQKLVMQAVKRSKEVLRHHFVRMMRNMITTLNTAMVKLDQDKDRLASGHGCGKDIVTIVNDRKYLTGLAHFITHSVRFVDDKDPEKKFKVYYTANKGLISKLAIKKIRISDNE